MGASTNRERDRASARAETVRGVSTSVNDEVFMDLALAEARAAAERGEVPVGAVVVRDGEVIGRGRNLREASQDPTAHAEMLALRAASRTLRSWRLVGCAIYVTLEPCAMCLGAIIQARVERLVYGCADPKAGAVVSLFRLADHPGLNHHPAVTGGIRGRECSELLERFFAELRARKKAERE
jgi:tRNA(adenine34) deaminase